jgi:hypothetical protein
MTCPDDACGSAMMPSPVSLHVTSPSRPVLLLDLQQMPVTPLNFARLALCSHPNCGELLAKVELRYIDFAGTRIVYSDSIGVRTVYLFAISRAAVIEPVPDTSQKNRHISRAADLISKGLIMMAIKRSVSWIWENLTHL